MEDKKNVEKENGKTEEAESPEHNRGRKLISLKEAARISGYNPDYIGQLIRSGEVPGKPVYREISWVTTAEAILAYKNRKSKKRKKGNLAQRTAGFFLGGAKNKLVVQLQLVKLFLRTFRWALPVIAIIIVCFSILAFFFFTQVFQNHSIIENGTIRNQKIYNESGQDFSY